MCIMQASRNEYSPHPSALHIHDGTVCLDVHHEAMVELLELGCCHCILWDALLLLLLLRLSNTVHFLLFLLLQLQLLTEICINCLPFLAAAFEGHMWQARVILLP